MGTILPKWKRQKSSKETLEALEREVQSLVQNRKKTQQCERSLIGTIIVAFFLLYPLILLVGVVLWVWFNHLLSLEISVIFILLISLFPIMFYGFRKLISTYFIHRQTQYDLALQVLHSEKKKVLDEVMEKEPYKVARELLEKYEPSHSSLQPFTNKIQQPETPNVIRQRVLPPQTPVVTPHPALRHRNVPPPATPLPPTSSLSISSTVPSTPVTTNSTNSTISSGVREQVSVTQLQQTPFVPPGHCFGPSPGPPYPAPILPRERSNFDKIVEYILGDGPSNRYALICSKCQSHNGMALKEDFEYLAFRCAYCYELNPARKVKPTVANSSIINQDKRINNNNDNDDTIKPPEESLEKREDGKEINNETTTNNDNNEN